MLLLLACGIDNGLHTEPERPSPFDDAEDAADSAAIAGDDPCNGADDNGDGVVDEGYGDLDGDGVADCVDDACELEVGGAAKVAEQAACALSSWSPPDAPDTLVVEWSLRGPNLLSTPIVANLDDDDGDGLVTPADVPEILGVDFETGDLHAYAGDGSGLVWRRSLGLDPMGIAAADLDGDGASEVIALGARGLCAFDGVGDERWCNRDAAPAYNGGPTLADLDRDGVPEVISTGVIADGATGDTLATPVCADGDTFPVVGDLDGDGSPEIICGAEVWHADGAPMWSDGAGSYDYAALVDVDLDGAPEVLVSGWGTGLRLYSAAGDLLATADPGGYRSAACVADFDGDGLPEIAAPSQTRIDVYDTALHLRWFAATSDNSGAASCSAFDFDGDGAYELVYADEIALHVYDGRTGAERYTWSDHRSDTMWEYPVIADVDQDGAAEIVLFESGSEGTGLVVLGSSTSAWPPTGPTWSQYSFDGGNVSDGGAVLVDPPAPWRDGGFSHARPPGWLDDTTGTWSTSKDALDLAVSIADVCAADCVDGPVEVAVTATNTSSRAVETVVTLYSEGSFGLVELSRTQVELPAETRGAPVTFSILPEQVGVFGLRATVRRADAGADCDESDNAAVWIESPCG